MKIRKWLKPFLCITLLMIMLCSVFTTASADQWVNSNGRWWYRYSNGSYPRNQWKQIRGTWYYFDAAGWMLTGKQNIGGQTYIFDNSGAMVTGWFQLGKTWYFAEGSGSLARGWRQIGGSWYYFDDDSCAMLTGWWTINQKHYYFYDNGKMAANCWVDDVWVNPDGSVATALHVDTTAVTLRVGQIVPKTVSLDTAGSVYWEADDTSIVNCMWSDVWKNDETTLYIYGLRPGTTRVYVKNTVTSIYFWFDVTVTR